nr:MAG TPA: hypothetical protein [Caudoviricetes sp.]
MSLCFPLLGKSGYKHLKLLRCRSGRAVCLSLKYLYYC